MVVGFEVAGKPQAKQRPRFGNGRTYTPKETVMYENLVKLSYKEANRDAPIMTGPVYMNIIAYYPIPSSWSKKKKAEAEQGKILKTGKPDMDNLIKSICDALNGIAYEDDSQVVEVYAKKRYSERPRVSVTIGDVNE